MSEYAQIQTYASCTSATFPELLQRYRKVLIQSGCRDQQVLNWLEDIRWPQSEEDGLGDIYAAPVVLSPSGEKAISSAGIEVSLYVDLGVISMEDLPAWVGFNILLETVHLHDSPELPYRVADGRSIWQILLNLYATFPEVGAYFTDEWQENQAWRVIIEHQGDPWVFELGVFPRALATQFAEVPAGFQGTVIDEGFGFAQTNRWERLPWQDKAV
jgi:hypothetical protein